MDVSRLGSICCEQTAARKTEKKKNENVQKAQQRFLEGIAAGKSEKEAFIDSFEVLQKKEKTEQAKLGGSQYLAYKSFKMPKISPDDAKKWLEVIAIAVPLVQGIIDYVEDKIKNNKPAETPTPAQTPVEQAA